MARFLEAFLSYSTQDADLVIRVADALGRYGVVPWIDRSEIKGGSLQERLQSAVGRAGRVVVFLSTHAVKSNWVSDEVAEALKLPRESVLPVFLGDREVLVAAQKHLRAAWQLPDGRVDQLGVESGDADEIAQRVAEWVLDSAGLAQAPVVGVLVDQRGQGQRTGRPDSTTAVVKAVPEDAPVLVFRPDRGGRGFSDFLGTQSFRTFGRAIGDSLCHLGELARREVHVQVNGQLALAALVGNRLNRTGRHQLVVHHREGTTASLDFRAVISPPKGRQVPEAEGPPLAGTVALSLAKVAYRAEVQADAAARGLPLVEVLQSDEMIASQDEVDAVLAGWMGALHTLKNRGVRQVEVYSSLPDFVLVLAFSMVPPLFEHVGYIDRLRPGMAYEPMPMPSYSQR